MDTPNLFSRIEGYAQENFTTEILAYILETDARVRNAFLDLLLDDQPPAIRKLRKSFQSCELETQPSFDFGRPDLKITSKSNPGATVFVEVKTQSPEGESQIQRYLKHHIAYLAYLTPLGHDAPDLEGADNKRYLGQFFWPAIYSVIQKTDSHNALHKQFLKYLEERRMGPSEPISKNDLRASLHAADAIRKFQALVAAVRKEIERDWEREFGTNVGGKEVNSGLADGSLPYWWFRPRKWKKLERRPYLGVGVWAEKKIQDKPCFYVELGIRRKFGRKLEEDLDFNGLRNDIGWKAYHSPTWWEYYKTFPVGIGNINDIAQQQIRNIRSASKEIRKLATFVTKRNLAR